MHKFLSPKYLCNSVRAGAKRSYCTVDCVAELIGTDSLMHIVPDVWAHRTDSLQESSLT